MPATQGVKHLARTRVRKKRSDGQRLQFVASHLMGLSGLLVALGGSCSRPPETPGPQLPAYSLDEAVLFADLFRPELFDVVQSETPERDGLLPERTEYADSVYAARCMSITRGEIGEVRSYSVVVVPAGDVLAGQAPSGPVTLSVGARSPAAAWLDMATGGWVGTRFILFLRHYQDGPHFYATVDSPAVRRAISLAAALRGRNKPSPALPDAGSPRDAGSAL